MRVGVANVVVAKVLCVSEKTNAILGYYSNAKSFPGGLQDFSSSRSQRPGEGKGEVLSSVYSIQFAVDRLTGGDSVLTG